MFWVIDIATRCAEVWTPTSTTPAYEETLLTWRPQEAAEAFTMPLTTLFAP